MISRYNPPINFYSYFWNQSSCKKFLNTKKILFSKRKLVFYDQKINYFTNPFRQRGSKTVMSFYIAYQQLLWKNVAQKNLLLIISKYRAMFGQTLDHVMNVPKKRFSKYQIWIFINGKNFNLWWFKNLYQGSIPVNSSKNVLIRKLDTNVTVLPTV